MILEKVHRVGGRLWICGTIFSDIISDCNFVAVVFTIYVVRVKPICQYFETCFARTAAQSMYHILHMCPLVLILIDRRISHGLICREWVKSKQHVARSVRVHLLVDVATVKARTSTVIRIAYHVLSAGTSFCLRATDALGNILY